jgi:hypothetical protein
VDGRRGLVDRRRHGDPGQDRAEQREYETGQAGPPPRDDVGQQRDHDGQRRADQQRLDPADEARGRGIGTM